MPGEKNDGPEGGDGEDGEQNRLWGFRLVPVEDVVGELDVMCENEDGFRWERGGLPGWRRGCKGRDAS